MLPTTPQRATHDYLRNGTLDPFDPVPGLDLRLLVASVARRGDRRRQIQADQAERETAYSTRNTWRRTLVALVLTHAPDPDSSDDASAAFGGCGRVFFLLHPSIAGRDQLRHRRQVARFEQMHERQ